MIDKTSREIVRTLFVDSGAKSASTESKIDVLVAMVLDLMMEVESLRVALLEESGGARGENTAYGRAYRETALLTHSSIGPTSGLEKLIDRFYPAGGELDRGAPEERRTWREALMLRRLGFSSEEIGAYKAEARTAETYT